MRREGEGRERKGWEEREVIHISEFYTTVLY